MLHYAKEFLKKKLNYPPSLIFLWLWNYYIIVIEWVNILLKYIICITILTTINTVKLHNTIIYIYVYIYNYIYNRIMLIKYNITKIKLKIFNKLIIFKVLINISLLQNQYILKTSIFFNFLKNFNNKQIFCQTVKLLAFYYHKLYKIFTNLPWTLTLKFATLAITTLLIFLLAETLYTVVGVVTLTQIGHSYDQFTAIGVTVIRTLLESINFIELVFDFPEPFAYYMEDGKFLRSCLTVLRAFDFLQIWAKVISDFFTYITHLLQISAVYWLWVREYNCDIVEVLPFTQLESTRLWLEPTFNLLNFFFGATSYTTTLTDAGFRWAHLIAAAPAQWLPCFMGCVFTVQWLLFDITAFSAVSAFSDAFEVMLVGAGVFSEGTPPIATTIQFHTVTNFLISLEYKNAMLGAINLSFFYCFSCFCAVLKGAWVSWAPLEVFSGACVCALFVAHSLFNHFIEIFNFNVLLGLVREVSYALWQAYGVVTILPAAFAVGSNLELLSWASQKAATLSLANEINSHQPVVLWGRLAQEMLLDSLVLLFDYTCGLLSIFNASGAFLHLSAQVSSALFLASELVGGWVTSGLPFLVFSYYLAGLTLVGWLAHLFFTGGLSWRRVGRLEAQNAGFVASEKMFAFLALRSLVRGGFSTRNHAYLMPGLNSFVFISPKRFRCAVAFYSKFSYSYRYCCTRVRQFVSEWTLSSAQRSVAPVWFGRAVFASCVMVYWYVIRCLFINNWVFRGTENRTAGARTPAMQYFFALASLPLFLFSLFSDTFFWFSSVSFTRIFAAESLTAQYINPQRNFNSRFLRELSDSPLRFSADHFSASQLAVKYFFFVDTRLPNYHESFWLKGSPFPALDLSTVPALADLELQFFKHTLFNGLFADFYYLCTTDDSLRYTFNFIALLCRESGSVTSMPLVWLLSLAATPAVVLANVFTSPFLLAGGQNVTGAPTKEVQAGIIETGTCADLLALELTFLHFLVVNSFLDLKPFIAYRLLQKRDGWMSNQIMSWYWHYRLYDRWYVYFRRRLRRDFGGTSSKDAVYLINTFRVFEQLPDLVLPSPLFVDSAAFSQKFVGATKPDGGTSYTFSTRALSSKREYRVPKGAVAYTSAKRESVRFLTPEAGIVRFSGAGYTSGGSSFEVILRRYNVFFSDLSSKSKNSPSAVGGVGAWSLEFLPHNYFFRWFYYRYWTSKQAYYLKFLFYEKFQFFKRQKRHFSAKKLSHLRRWKRGVLAGRRVVPWAADSYRNEQLTRRLALFFYTLRSNVKDFWLDASNLNFFDTAVVARFRGGLSGLTYAAYWEILNFPLLNVGVQEFVLAANFLLRRVFSVFSFFLYTHIPGYYFLPYELLLKRASFFYFFIHQGVDGFESSHSGGLVVNGAFVISSAKCTAGMPLLSLGPTCAYRLSALEQTPKTSIIIGAPSPKPEEVRESVSALIT